MAAAAASAPPHVLVIGSGLAGLTAALTAAAAGARVTVLEKEKATGGNSAKATSGMNACGTPAQAAAGISDTPAAFFADTIASGHGVSSAPLVRVLTEQSAAAIAFLRDCGVDLAAVTLCGGHSVARTHHEAPRADGKPTPVGWDLVSTLRRAAGEKSTIAFRQGLRVTELLTAADGSRTVTGVRTVATGADTAVPAGTAESLHADAVILATGGFANDHTADSLLTEFAPQLACLPTTNGPFATGDGVKLARAIGAHLVGMEHVQVHPTGLVDRTDRDNRTKFLGPEALRGVGGLLFTRHGKRFVNELDRRDAVSAAMYRHCHVPAGHTGSGDATASADGDVPPRPVHAYIVLSAEGVSRFGPNFGFYWKVKGFFAEVHGPDGVAAEINALAGADATAVTGESIAAELSAYTAAAAAGRDAFGKTAFPDDFAMCTAADAKLYVAIVTPAIHYTMGGVAMNAAAELMYADDSEVVLARRLEEEALAAAVGTTADDSTDSPMASPAAVAAMSTGVHVPTGETPKACLPGPGADASANPIIPVMAPVSSAGAGTGATVIAAAGAGAGAGASASAPPARLLATQSSYDLSRSARLAEIEGTDGDEDRSAGTFERPVLRPISRLFGAGEVTGGVHGGNRLAGNSLLECVVFGRIAGRRAAAVHAVDAAAPTVAALSPDSFTPLAFRESYLVATNVYLCRFDLPSPLQTCGFAVGQYIAVRAVLDGKEVVRFYSPISRPDAPGHIDLLLKIDASGGLMTTHINALRPGDTLDFKGPLGTLSLDFSPRGSLGAVKRIGLIAGGTGLAPMAQILRSIFYNKRDDIPVRMIYAAASPDQLAMRSLLKRKAALHRNFTLMCAVDKVPSGATWHEHVGFITAPVIASFMHPPAPDVLIVICGPYPMCQALKKALDSLGYAPAMYYSFM